MKISENESIEKIEKLLNKFLEIELLHESIQAQEAIIKVLLMQNGGSIRIKKDNMLNVVHYEDNIIDLDIDNSNGDFIMSLVDKNDFN